MSSSRRVPWSCTNEWIDVYNWVFSDDAGSQSLAGKRILAWRSRATLPASVDATSSFLSALCFDREYGCRSVMDDSPIRCSYGVALMRFVNAFTEFDQTGVYATSVQLLASRLGIPEWIVDARHSVAHNDLPGIEVLRGGAQVCMQWLRDNYWEPQFRQWQEAESNVRQSIMEYSEKAREALSCRRGKKNKKNSPGVQVSSVSSLSQAVTQFLPSCSESFPTYNLLVTELLRISEVAMLDKVHGYTWPLLADIVRGTAGPHLTCLPDNVLTVCWPLLKWCQSGNQGSFFQRLIEEFGQLLHIPPPEFPNEREPWWQRHVLVVSWILSILSEARKTKYPQQRLLKVKTALDCRQLLECVLCVGSRASYTGCSVFSPSLVESILETCPLDMYVADSDAGLALQQKIMALAKSAGQLSQSDILLVSMTNEQIGGDDVADDPDWSSCCIGESPFDSCRDLSLPASFDDVPC